LGILPLLPLLPLLLPSKAANALRGCNSGCTPGAMLGFPPPCTAATYATCTHTSLAAVFGGLCRQEGMPEGPACTDVLAIALAVAAAADAPATPAAIAAAVAAAAAAVVAAAVPRCAVVPGLVPSYLHRASTCCCTPKQRAQWGLPLHGKCCQLRQCHTWQHASQHAGHCLLLCLLLCLRPAVSHRN
jgi:hypothetical protein